MKKILIVTGEISADYYAAELVRKLFQKDSKLEIFATGGKELSKTRAKIIFPIDRMGVTGFTEVIGKLPAFLRLFSQIKRLITEQNIDLVILMDYPGLNLKIASFCKRNNIRVFYYIVPQVWAWGKRRIPRLIQYADKLLVIFPFEKRVFADKGTDCIYAGHPLVDKIRNYKFDTDTLTRIESIHGTRITLLPGSRENELSRILPDMARTAEKLLQWNEDISFMVPLAENLDAGTARSILGKILDRCHFFPGKIYEALKFSDFAIVTSGTATLETAMFGVPMVILYRTKRSTYFLAKRLVNIENIGLANILLGKRVFPEFIQDDIDPEKIASHIKGILGNPDRAMELKRQALRIRDILGRHSSSEIVSEIIGDELTKS